ncbi:MAG: hypothetical protein IPN53_21520 [Comamonadaceae bacterium]|nr:hypothetical protein [Comamonadaceae bacterium]
MTPETIHDGWLDVLAGKVAPTDRETRQSASLRGFFELQEQNTPKLDEATQRRIMNALEAKGVFAQAATPKRVAPESLLTRISDWLFPDGHASGGRWSAVAAAIMAVTVLPFVLHSPVGDDDPGSIKSLPTSINATLDTPTAVINSHQPQLLAAQLVTALARHGVVAELRSEGTDHWVKAHIPSDKQAVVQTDLVNMGLAAKPDGQLVVQFRRQP